MDSTGDFLITKEGLEKLETELKEREGKVRKHIANTLDEMRNQGDLRENDAYSMAIEEQHINEERILEIRLKIKNAKVVKDRGKDTVGVGDTVVLEGEKKLEYQLVSEEETNPLEGKISYLSPIGKSVMGKKIGEKIQIETPKGSISYKIVSIG
ncbi:MAG TPA: transcription elongation factor GreA [Candidatus Dojkabacteria bacterium]|jgi:transcription elongation factor GreA|uniref:Transcription elongation factor GreA n=1 Tax=Candidatus Dojkabacteria bacterium TaxID=2099670 RepID=A0A847CYS5_9BACT|nr:transcription elongation factor GreA [Candidatus Dojkabacteria bacterium]NLD25317.1 transcription elongation factor GreA [Candidatus Dojkabacteria bacterium]HNW32879.1 transcription elongation factor GreA [Candidatus Dojkabacteria bacterium]HQC39298.1 transcription elongation factor GreA [Candidatus Dojkabacteria bacterium]